MSGGCKPPPLCILHPFFECIQSVWASSYGWAYGWTLTLILLQLEPNFGHLRVRRSPNNIMVSCLEAVSHLILYLTCIEDDMKCLSHSTSHDVDGHLGAPLHCYTCAGWGPNFGNLGVKESPSASNIMVSFLEAINQPILLLTSIMDDMKCFSTFLWCGWAFGCTFTLL